MIKVIYEDLCPVCGGDLSEIEIEKNFCQHSKKPLNAKFITELDQEFEDIFKKLVGEPREIQRLWMKRLNRAESFTAVAPTGIGKTTFGLVSALFFALKKKKTYIIVPTSILVNQLVENIKQFNQKVDLEIGLNEKKDITVAYYFGRLKKRFKQY